MVDRVVLKDGRCGRLIETLPRGYRVQFVGPDRFETERVSDGDVLDVQYDWPLYVSELEESAMAIYAAKAQSPQEPTPEWWATIVERFPGSARHCLHLAQRLADDPDDDLV